MHNDPIADSLRRSKENLETISNSMRGTMSRTSQEVKDTWEGRRPPEAPPAHDPQVGLPRDSDRTHVEAKSDYDYDTPYGRFDRNNYHAVCIDVDNKIYFLGGESKEELEKKVNTDDKIKDVLAVYGGNLIYYHERRYLHLD